MGKDTASIHIHECTRDRRRHSTACVSVPNLSSRPEPIKMTDVNAKRFAKSVSHIAQKKVTRNISRSRLWCTFLRSAVGFRRTEACSYCAITPRKVSLLLDCWLSEQRVFQEVIWTRSNRTWFNVGMSRHYHYYCFCHSLSSGQVWPRSLSIYNLAQLSAKCVNW